MPKIAIINKSMPLYRRDFYNGLRKVLSENNIELLLLYGQPSPRDALKNDTIDIDWAVKVPSKIWEFGHTELYWQPVLSYLRDVDLVIVEQASKLLVNYVLLIQHWFNIRKLAFWGHGKNFQENSANHFGEWIKRKVSTRIHPPVAIPGLPLVLIQASPPTETMTVPAPLRMTVHWSADWSKS